MSIEEVKANYDEVHDMLRDEYVLMGDFVLSSGQRSNVYIDVKSATTEHRFMTHLLPLLDGYCNPFVDDANCERHQVVLVGLESGAIPLLTGLQIKYGWAIAWVRKHQKDYGLKNNLIGFLDSEDKIIIIEDVLNTGAGIGRVAGVVGIDRVLGVVCVVNRSDLGDRINITDRSGETKVVDVRSVLEMKHLWKP
jgi:orotate phosphoribosyltransferase